MQDVSARLSLPYIMPNQAQKHVSHNEGIAHLDVLVQMVLEETGAATPPTVPVEGLIWALGAVPTGAWAGQADHLATWQNGGWVFVAPQSGWRAVVRGENAVRLWTGSAWALPALGDLNQLVGVGIGTDFDVVNALSVAADATLLSHSGGGHQLKINKAAAGDTASLLFQTAWGGRAEMGTAGSDDFEVKVSADGSTWFTGLRVEAASGQLSAPEGLAVTGQITGSAVMQSTTDTTPGRVMTVGAFGQGAVNLAAIADIDATLTPTGAHATASATVGTLPPGNPNGLLQHWSKDPQTAYQTWQSVLGNDLYHRRARVGVWQGWSKFYDTGNTTVDANGFVKAASPIVRLARDGIEEPVEAVGAVFARKGVGHYTLSDVAALATSGWQIEVPQDHNGNRLVFVTTSYNTARRVLTIKTRTVTWDSTKGLWAGGKPIDIPTGRWVDIRLFKPDQESPTDVEM